MTASVQGAIVGLLFAFGVIVAVRSSPPMRHIRIGDRVSPYLVEAPRSRLLINATAGAPPFQMVRRLLGPSLAEAVRTLDRVVGGSASVRRRLGGLNSTMTAEEFRVEQVVWGALGLVGGVLLGGSFGLTHGGVNPVTTAAVALALAAFGVLGRDWALTRQLEHREQAMLAEFPVIADLLALAVTAGEAAPDALARVCRLTSGELARDLRDALNRSRAGGPLTKALTEVGERSTLDPFTRFIQGVVVAIDRGTPLAQVLRAQAADVREIGKRALLEAGGRKEISMMLPVVFLILPVTVVFALYPGLLTLTSLAR
jgi:tight adherence protein C